METSIPADWADFGVAAAGATAALAGLLIVAMSVNVKEILASKALVHGARSTIASLVLAIVVSLLMIPPDQPALLLGIETLVITVIAAVIHAISIAAQRRTTAEGITRYVLAFIVGLAVVEHVPFLVGAVLLMLGIIGGMWGLVAGVAVVVIASLVNAWVLLFEVRR